MLMTVATLLATPASRSAKGSLNRVSALPVGDDDALARVQHRVR